MNILHIAIDLETDACSKDLDGSEETELAARKAWVMAEDLGALGVPTMRVWFKNRPEKTPDFFASPEPYDFDSEVEKTTQSIGDSPEALDQVKDHDPDIIIVSGVYLSHCVKSSIMSLRDEFPEAQIFLASNATAEDPSMELFQQEQSLREIEEAGISIQYASRIVSKISEISQPAEESALAIV